MTTIVRSGSFELDLPPWEALVLFTAPGEKLWIADWDPEILYGDGFEPGTVFVTRNHGPTSYWLVCDFDRDAGHARYARVTPESDSGTVDVQVTPNNDGGSTINVTYQLTGLTPAGNDRLATSYSAPRYATMLQNWQGMIRDSRATIDEHLRHAERRPGTTIAATDR